MPSRAHPKLSRTIANVFLACLIVCVGLLANWTPALVGAASIVVDTTADTLDYTGEPTCATTTIADLPGGGDGKISLREAICAANNTPGDDIITFNLPNPSTILPVNPYVITSNIQITGPGADILDIDGDGETRLFTIDSGTVGISGLTLRAGFADYGGAIYNSGTLTLTDTIVTNSTAVTSGPSFGGGIYNGNSLTLLRTTVEDNRATFGGGIYSFGTLNSTDSTIHANTAQGGSGGGIYNEGQATIVNTAFTRNLATANFFGGGGGIASGNFLLTLRPAVAPAVEKLAPSVSLTGVTMSDNSAPAGGALATNQSGATIATSTIQGNSACLGGGIYDFLGSLAIDSSTIAENSATLPNPNDEPQFVCPEANNDGGGIWVNGTLTLTNSTISDNRAQDSGGGLYLQGTVVGGEPAQIKYSTITNNRADTDTDESIDGGGGIFYQYIQNGLIEAAAANGVQLNSSIVAGNLGPSGEEDCDGTIISTGHNLVGSGTGCPTGGTGDLTTTDITTVLNTTLANNGGPTQTHALIAGSAALNAGDPATCPATDQRGIGRPSGSGCDIGAFELISDLVLTVQTTGSGTVAASPAPTSTSGTATNKTYTYPAGTVVTLTVTPGNGQVFARWIIDGAGTLPYGKGWASPLTITLDANHTAQAQFETRPNFTDVPTSNAAAIPITELAARGIIKGYTKQGCDRLNTGLPCYGPGDLTERAQSAALLVRLLGLESENHGNGGFTDLAGLDPELQRAVGTVAFHGIMQGYGNGKFGPFDKITHLQTVLVISRGFVFKGYWTRATVDDPSVYPNLTLTPGERLDLVTFVKNAGPLPGFANNTQRAAVDQPAHRDWTAQAFWLALNDYFSVDQPGKGGFVP